ncbi:hypothetical protein PANDA_008764, partial [Ailuropoda melanoleuca]
IRRVQTNNVQDKYLLMKFSRPPSAPRNLAFNINETALILEWSPPSDTGGRKDLTYSVICKKCGLDTSQCEDCGGGLRFIPRHSGLINNSVIVLDFVSHVNYTFEIEAMNGVSELSFSPKPFTAITVTTDQDQTRNSLLMPNIPGGPIFTEVQLYTLYTKEVIFWLLSL